MIVAKVTIVFLLQYNRVWIPDNEEVWQSAEITKNYRAGDRFLHVQLEDGTVRRKAWIIVGFAEICLCRNIGLTVIGSK